MKNTTTNFSIVKGMLFLLVVGYLSPHKAIAQNVPSLFVVVDYMKVKPGDHAEYLDVEQNIWKPLHEERIDRGILVGWLLYAVQFSGSDDRYNYVVINLYDNADYLETPWEPGIPQKVHPKLSIDEISQRTQNSRETVKSELFYSVATAPAIPLEVPAAYMEVNYMNVKPGLESQYEQLESDIWLPIHNESINSGHTTGWGLWRALYPSGAGQEYQYLTLNTFSNFANIFGLDFSVPFNIIHPDKDFNEVLDQTQKTRTTMRTELWDLIDYAIR